jgi:hypothetical protein
MFYGPEAQNGRIIHICTTKNIITQINQQPLNTNGAALASTLQARKMISLTSDMDDRMEVITN